MTNHAQIAVTGDFDPKNAANAAKSVWFMENQTALSKSLHLMSLLKRRKYMSCQNSVSLEVTKCSYHACRCLHPDAPALIILSHIMGNSQLSSRLAQELREKNALVYGFGSNLDLDSDTESGSISITANYTAGRSDQVSQSVHKVLTDLLKKV